MMHPCAAAMREDSGILTLGETLVFSDLALARRLEAAEAANAKGCTAIHAEAASMDVAGGCAVFVGAESPLTHAVGIGLSGPVRVEEIAALEEFFRDRGAKVAIDLCPLADAGLLPLLGERGYRLTEFSNVLVRRLAGREIVMTPRVRRVLLPEETDLWSHTVGRGFFDESELTTEEMDVGRAICAMPGALCYLATASTGEPAGAAALAVYGGLATLFADSTIAQFRRGGVHAELIAARLNEALAEGCELATASTLPGSGSQRNYERLGFEVVYTRVTMTQ
jgi:GNAT superfamily N-acetyltransferase